jgi:hypothetical protein
VRGALAEDPPAAVGEGTCGCGGTAPTAPAASAGADAPAPPPHASLAERVLALRSRPGRAANQPGIARPILPADPPGKGRPDLLHLRVHPEIHLSRNTLRFISGTIISSV